MSIEDLHDLAAKIHDFKQANRGGAVPPPSDLLMDAMLQAVHEIRGLTSRIRVLEGKPSLD